MVDLSTFKRAMGSFPSGVVIAITRDAGGEPWGFTASSFSSVSLDPPLVLLCLGKSAECHAAFAAAVHFSVSILAAGDEALATRFATRGASKFQGDGLVVAEHGLPLVRDAVASLVCRKFANHDCGDHTVIVGEVLSVCLAPAGDSMVYYRGHYGQFTSREVDLRTAAAPGAPIGETPAEV
jgi:flavin reductase ActVB